MHKPPYLTFTSFMSCSHWPRDLRTDWRQIGRIYLRRYVNSVVNCIKPKLHVHLQCLNTLRHVSSPWQGGTGGTIAGVSRYLKQRNPAIKTYLVDPEGSSLYSYVTKVCHRE